jgi:hypothetical protein
MPMYMPRQQKLSAFNRWTASYGRAYFLPGLRPSFDKQVRAPWQSLEEAADNSRGREAVVEGNLSIERRRCGTKSNFGEIGFSGINPLKIKDKDMS